MPSAAVVVCTSDDQALLAQLLDGVRTGAPVAVLDASWPTAMRATLAAALDAAVQQGRVASGDLVLGTSGSSGSPRAVVRTVASWDASLGPLSQITGITGHDVVWLPGSLASTLSLYGAWHARALGAGLLLRSATDVSSATVVHTVPSVLARLAEAPDRVPSLRTVVVAGDRLLPATRAAARSRGWDVVEYYGAAELSFVAHRRDDGFFTPFPAVEVEVRDGVVWVRSAYLARGRLAVDQGPVAAGPWRAAGGWATVGDRGALLAGGLELHGRGDEAVVTGGSTVLAADVERHLATVPGVLGVAVVGTPDSRLGQVVTAVLSGTASRRDLLSAAAGLPAPSRPRRWVRVDALPLTAAGKVSRSEVAAGLLAGTLQPAAPDEAEGS